MTTVRASYWLVTMNNPTDSDRALLKSPEDYVKQMWYQDEIGEEGTLHIQLCINTTQVRFSQIKDWLPRAHIEAARNSQACKNYCKKSATSVPGTFIYYKAGTSNAITEPELESMTGDLLYLFNNLPFNWQEMDPDIIYSRTLHYILEERPALVNRLTTQRIQQNFNLVFMAFLEFARESAEMSNLPDDPLDRQTVQWDVPDTPEPCEPCRMGKPHKCERAYYEYFSDD